MNFPRFSLAILLSSVFIFGCSNDTARKDTVKGDFIVKNFDPMVNWQKDSTGNQQNSDENRRYIFLDYSGAHEKGFIIPTIKQVPEGQFQIEFSLKNTGEKARKYYYKIFYQNESYKFPEKAETDSLRQHMYAFENFYGSWEDISRKFAETPLIGPDGDFHIIRDQFRITGNPRDEKKYYSQQNDRWKRNPRVGNYSFMLVVTTEEDLQRIPEYVKNVSLEHEGSFVHPYFYFLHGPGKQLSSTLAVGAPFELKVTARPDPGAGVFVSPTFFADRSKKQYYCATCGESEDLRHNAPYEQFTHYIDASTKMDNIPVIADVLKDNYSLTDYNWNRQFYKKEELISLTASENHYPCKTVISDAKENKITIINPGVTFGKWEKQNTGIITRHGFTYGKWTVKAKLSELLNKNSLWNGLTNAIWLITQSQEPWNFRRNCSKEGYMATYWGGQNDKRVPTIGYSEIDFEILKTVPYCPGYVLPPAYNYGLPDQTDMTRWNIPFPEEIVPGEIQVACTNWDMACWEPTDFFQGCKAVVYEGKTYWAHRWDKNYRALTQKVPEQDDELFASEYYYFQIDWQPTRIIWRIGPSKDKLRVVGYQDQTITSIPNNQMLLIITQEFHNTRWWVGSPYSQENIPFPANDIKGEIFEVTID